MGPLPPPTLNPAQQKVIEYGVLDSGFSVVLQMQTGSGKTFLAREAIRSSVNRGFRAIYLSPLRALADELAKSWSEEFKGMDVGVFTGDYGAAGKALPVPYSRAQVLIMTPERLDACTRCWRSHWSWIPEVDWVVVDEIHLLGERQRGARLEGTISRFRRLNPFARILGLSATLGNRQELADWMDGVDLKSDWRPVPLRWSVVRYKKPAEKPALLSAEVARNRKAGGQSIVFVQSRRRAEELARHLDSQGIRAAHHHAGLSHASRAATEADFRSGRTGTLVATGTLEMGLNLPARQVVLYDLQEFDGEGFRPLPVNTVWQRAGRAGRPGLDEEGEAVLLAANWDRQVDDYPLGRFEPVRSHLADPAILAEQILVEVHSGMARKEVQLVRVFRDSLSHHTGTKDGTLRRGHPVPVIQVKSTVDKMLESGMLRRDEEKDLLVATRIGRVACRHQLQPDTLLAIRDFLNSTDQFTNFDLLLVLTATPDCSPMLPVDFEELEHLADALSCYSSFLLREPGSPGIGVSGKRLLSALKTAQVLLRWTECGDAETVAEEDGIYPFELHRLIECFERLMLAAISVQRILEQPSVASEGDDHLSERSRKSADLRRMELLQPMILHGLDARAASLTLVNGIGSGWATKLVAAGVRNLADLANASPGELAKLRGVSKQRAGAWVREARELPVSIPSEPAGPRIRTLPPDTEIDVDPYRLRRALDLQVLARGTDRWQVTGGLEPHEVLRSKSFTCNCADFSSFSPDR